MRRIKGLPAGKAGFTLIEVLIYALIFVIVVGGMMLYAIAMLTSSERADTRVEVADNSRFMIQKLQRVIQGAVKINSPAVNASDATLSLDTATASWNPFTMYVVNFGPASGSLLFRKGAAAPVLITDSFVKISSVSFKNYSFSTSTKNTIRFKAKVQSVEPYHPVSNSIDIFISIQ